MVNTQVLAWREERKVCEKVAVFPDKNLLLTQLWYDEEEYFLHLMFSIGEDSAPFPGSHPQCKSAAIYQYGWS